MLWSSPNPKRQAAYLPAEENGTRPIQSPGPALRISTTRRPLPGLALSAERTVTC